MRFGAHNAPSDEAFVDIWTGRERKGTGES